MGQTLPNGPQTQMPPPPLPYTYSSSSNSSAKDTSSDAEYAGDASMGDACSSGSTHKAEGAVECTSSTAATYFDRERVGVVSGRSVYTCAFHGYTADTRITADAEVT
jgi:hypothetical protein